MGKILTADFETTTNPDDCRVWAYATCEVGNVENFTYGNSIDEFMEFCEGKENYKIFFHNLKFDGEFIMWWLINNNFEYIQDKKNRKSKTFTTLITDMGTIYAIEVFFYVKNHHVNKVTFYDSLKILNFSVEQIAKDFNLPINKLKIDYKKERSKTHQLTKQEIDYIKNDVTIVAMALDEFYKRGFHKITIGSNALSDFKSKCKNFNQYFPLLDNNIDDFCRKSYKGGFTYLNPIYTEKTTGNGIVFDVNSMYPAKMKFEKLPFGYPIYFDGEYKEDKLYNLYIINFDCEFKLKTGKIPSIQIKKNIYYKGNEYLTESKGLTNLTLTSVDYELFKDNYDVFNLTINGGYKFKSICGLFNNYIDSWTKEKINAKKENNFAMYRISKLFLNSLYGKFGISTNKTLKQPNLDENGIIKYSLYQGKDRKSLYTPMASFITSYARKYIIESSEKIREWSLNKYNEDCYIYSDTDSIHLKVYNKEEDINDLKNFINIDDYELGAWKPESEFERGGYIRQKCYIEEYQGKLNVTIAGFPKYLAPILKFEDFKIGFTTENLTLNDLIKKAKNNGASEEEISKIHHKLRYHHVKGGVILEDTPFTIK